MHLRTYDSRPTSIPKSGYQVIPLSGDRYILTIEGGVVISFRPYKEATKDYKPNYQASEQVQQWISNNEDMKQFSGVLEVMYNAHMIKIIDIMSMDSSTFDMENYVTRMAHLKHFKPDTNVKIQVANTDSSNLNSILIPTLLRPIDNSYQLGSDVLINATSRENLYIIMGSAREAKKPILLNKKDYTNLNEVPDAIKKIFVNSQDVTIDMINDWKRAMFSSSENEVIQKNDEEYILFENPEMQEIYLIGGVFDGTLKIFGKTSKCSKTLLHSSIVFDGVCELEDSVWMNPEAKNNLSDIEYYSYGFIIGTAKPKINGKKLTAINVLSVVAKTAFSNLENINEIPQEEKTLLKQKRKLLTVDTPSLAEEFINRIINEDDNVEEVNKLARYIKDRYITNKGTAYMNLECSQTKKRKYSEQ